MSFEVLFKPEKLVKSFPLVFLLSLIVATVAIFLSYRIFPESSSILIVTFTIIPLIPILNKLLENEEQAFEHEQEIHTKNFFKKHWQMSLHFFKRHKVIQMYLMLFLSLSIVFSLWYAFLPQEKANDLFNGQISALNGLSTGFTITSKPVFTDTCDFGFFATRFDTSTITNCEVVDYDKDFIEEYLITVEGEDDPTVLYSMKHDELYSYGQWMYFHVFTNNIQLLLFIFLTSFIFGAGAVFTLVWNASILGVFIGDAVHRTVNYFSKVPAYFTALSSSLASIAIHGILELTGFIFAALAGGILSVAIVKRIINAEHTEGKLMLIVKDSLFLLIFAIAFILSSALIEVM